MLTRPFIIKRPNNRNAVVVNIPHAATIIPEAIRSQFIISAKDLEHEIELLTDWYTDQLFSPFIEHGASAVISQLSRFVVDTERYEIDQHEPMSAQGMGVLYTHGTSRQRIRRDITALEREELLQTIYRPYHAALEVLVEEALTTFGRCTIIDAHSYPAEPLSYEINKNGPRPDICIGTVNKTHTPNNLVSLISECAEKFEYSVGCDSPFSGALIPQKFFGQAQVLSVMIEIKRSLYLEGTTSKVSAGYNKLQEFLTEISARIK